MNFYDLCVSNGLNCGQYEERGFRLECKSFLFWFRLHYELRKYGCELISTIYVTACCERMMEILYLSFYFDSGTSYKNSLHFYSFGK